MKSLFKQIQAGELNITTGKVGIGVINPQYILDINGSIGNSLGMNTGSYIDLGNSIFVDNTGAISFDYNQKILFGNWSGNGFSLDGPITISGNNVITEDETGQFYSSSNPSGFITGNLNLYSLDSKVVHIIGNEIISGNKTFSSQVTANGVKSNVFQDSSSINGIILNLGILTTGNDLSTDITIDMAHGRLSRTGVVHLDWFNNKLSGNWTAESLIISGQPVLTGSTISFITTGQTGQFASNSNLSATGSSLSTWTGNSTGLYYPRNSNPSGFITSGQTGIFAIDSNVVHITGDENIHGLKTFSAIQSDYWTDIYNNKVSIGGYLIDSNNNISVAWDGRVLQDSNITTSLDWSNRTLQDGNGIISLDYNNRRLLTTDGNPILDWQNGYISVFQNLNVDGIASFSNQLLISGNDITTYFYPKNNNPSGYITSGQTGIFASTGNLASTGNFISSWTGVSTGLYYPRNSNPSGYITSGNGCIIIQSQKINFAQTGNYSLFTVPSGQLFLIDTMEVITTNITSPNQPPYVSFGNTSSFGSYTSSIQTTSNSQYARHIFDNPQNAIISGIILTASITAASTATVQSGYLLYKGFFTNS